MTLSSQIVGFGHYAPSTIIHNHELEASFNLEAGWIESRTGIHARRWAGEGELLVDLAERAGMAALEDAGINKHEICLTILATSTPDHLLPPTSPLLAYRLGLSRSGAFDLSCACSGFLYALTMADSFVRAHAQPVLVVAANILSRRINFTEPRSAVLFGDAAGAVVIMPSTDATKGLLGVSLMSDGSSYDLISIPAGGSQRPFSPDIPLPDYKIKLNDGRAVFSKAIEAMTVNSQQAIKNANLSIDDIHRFIPHQANMRMIANIAKQLGISSEKTLTTICDYGNSSAASIPLTLSLFNQCQSFQTGERILLTAAGAGMTGGAMVLGL